MSDFNKAYKENPLSNLLFPIRVNRMTHPFTFPPHYHKALEIIYIHENTLTVEANHTLYHLKKGDLLIIGCNHIHSYLPSDESTDFTFLLFDWQLLEEVYKDKASFSQLHPLIFKINAYPQETYSKLSDSCEALIMAMHEELSLQERGYKFSITGYLYQLLALLIRTIDESHNQLSNLKSLEKEHNFLSTINAYIYNNYTEGITLSMAAEAAGYSDYHFTRQFKKYTGFTFKQYLTNFQISMAKEDLYDTSIPITDIAYEHGFKSTKTFNRIFKETYNQSPRSYRKAINETFEATNGK